MNKGSEENPFKAVEHFSSHQFTGTVTVTFLVSVYVDFKPQSKDRLLELCNTPCSYYTA